MLVYLRHRPARCSSVVSDCEGAVMKAGATSRDGQSARCSALLVAPMLPPPYEVRSVIASHRIPRAYLPACPPTQSSIPPTQCHPAGCISGSEQMQPRLPEQLNNSSCRPGNWTSRPGQQKWRPCSSNASSPRTESLQWPVARLASTVFASPTHCRRWSRLCLSVPSNSTQACRVSSSIGRSSPGYVADMMEQLTCQKMHERWSCLSVAAAHERAVAPGEPT